MGQFRKRDIRMEAFFELMKNLTRKEKPIVLDEVIYIMSLIESASRHSNAGLPFVHPRENEAKNHRLKSLIMYEALLRTGTTANGKPAETQELRKTMDELHQSAHELDKDVPDVSKMPTEELMKHQDTSLSYYHKKTVPMLLNLNIIKIVEDYACIFIAEINPSFDEFYNQLKSKSSHVSLEEAIVRVYIEKFGKNPKKSDRKIFLSMTGLCAFIDRFGKNGCIWKY